MPHPRRKSFRKMCAYCSHTFETRNPRQNTCQNCRALLKLTSPAITETASETT